MNFSQALVLIKQGYSVKRKEWGDSVDSSIFLEEIAGAPAIVRKAIDPKEAPSLTALSMSDVFAEDWVQS